MFQFHKVQLKVISVEVRVYNRLMFQFHKVQLKVGRVPFRLQLRVFQFHKVQLKARLIS